MSRQLTEKQKSYLEEHYTDLAIARLRAVRYGTTKVLWQFEDSKGSTLTLNHDEFMYFNALRKEKALEVQKMIKATMESLERTKGILNKKIETDEQ